MFTITIRDLHQVSNSNLNNLIYEWNVRKPFTIIYYFIVLIFYVSNLFYSFFSYFTFIAAYFSFSSLDALFPS